VDAGAHFYCSDLQVHTPRDRNWTGACPVTDADRTAFASNFIRACRTKGLAAVGITDHHDLAFHRYIKNAAQTETDQHGNILPPNKRIVIFPGIELTLGLPCQAILLFDPHVAETDLAQALPALGITPSEVIAAKGCEVERLAINDLNEIVRRLNQLPRLKNHFILLPNVNQDGADTILREGFFQHYKAMSCVGGYVDGSCVGHRKKNILDGKDEAWGFKRIGVLQTSDSREADFERLGAHPTWIKWSESTTEAIRQACLSPASRIRYSAPFIPAASILQIEVSASKYFGALSVRFNPQVNAIIGGRGSGKSTVLEYLRWALCDQPYGAADDDFGAEVPDYERRRKSLVFNTLQSARGDVIVKLEKDGVLHRIRREAATGRVWLSVASQPEQETTEEVIRSLGQVQGYSQKQLSHVSVRTKELVRLLTTPVARELLSIETEIRAANSGLKQAFERAELRRARELQLRAINQDLSSKNERLTTLSAQVRDLPPGQRAEIDAHPAFTAGQTPIDSFTTSLSTAESDVISIHEAIETSVRELPDVGTALPQAELLTLRATVDQGLQEISQSLERCVARIREITQNCRVPIDAATRLIQTHNDAYNAASSENAVVQEHLNSLRTLSQEIAAAGRSTATLLGQLEALSDSDTALAIARQRWLDAIRTKERLLGDQALRLTSSEGARLRVTFQRNKHTDILRNSLQDLVRGAGITVPDKFENAVRSTVLDADPISAWLALSEELISLARVGPHLATGAGLPRTQRLSQAGFIDTELRRVAAKLSPSAAFAESLIYPEVYPVFEYMTDDRSYIPFEDASPGQQATALIKILLNQATGPLIIDQPEDDLDNATILEVAEQLWKSKERRQIIFSTHNPNLVVIGDAELVIHCNYGQPGTSRIRISHEGAIDNQEVRTAIATVMEGGEEAFKLRKEKYGF
jgi:chromosome segregation protein